MSTGFPTPTITLHLASIDFSPMEFVTEGHRRRADAMLLRRTDRLPFAEPPDWDSVESQLRRTVACRRRPPRRHRRRAAPGAGGGVSAYRIASPL